jgi:hypothetical protein
MPREPVAVGSVYESVDRRAGLDRESFGGSVEMSQLNGWAASVGGRVAWGPATVLDAVRGDIRAHRDAGAFDPKYAAEVAEVDFDPSATTGTFRTVVLVALPLPAYAVTIVRGGRRTRVLLPPTYVRYRPSNEAVRLQLAERGLPG